MRKLSKSVWQTRLKREDWDFSKLPDNVAEDCWSWEWEREALLWCHGGRELPTYPLRPAAPGGNLCAWLNHPGEIPPVTRRQLNHLPEPWASHWVLLARGPDFPAQPYLSLPAAKKPPALTDRQRAARLEMPPHPDIRRSALFAHASLWVHWNRSNQEILDDFRAWLAVRRPTFQPRLHGSMARIDRCRALLKRLAAWRLLHHCSGNAVRAAGHPGAAEYLGRNFTHQSSSWSVAIKTIRKLIEHWKATASKDPPPWRVD